MQRIMPELLEGTSWFKYACDEICIVKSFKRCLGVGDVLLPQRQVLEIDPNVLVQLDTKTSGSPRKNRHRKAGELGPLNASAQAQI